MRSVSGPFGASAIMGRGSECVVFGHVFRFWQISLIMRQHQHFHGLITFSCRSTEGANATFLSPIVRLTFKLAFEDFNGTKKLVFS